MKHNLQEEVEIEEVLSNLDKKIDEIIFNDIAFDEKCQLISHELSSFFLLFPIHTAFLPQFNHFLKIFTHVLEISLQSQTIRNIFLRFLVKFCWEIDFNVVPPELVEIIDFYSANKSYLSQLDKGYIKAIKIMLDNSLIFLLK